MKNLALIALILMLAGCAAKTSTTGNVLARFDGTVLTDKEYEERLNSLPPEVRAYVSQHKKDFLNDMVSEHFLLKEAQSRGIQNDAEVKDLMEAARTKIIISRLVQKEVDDKVQLGNEEAEKYYNDHLDEFMTQLTLRASHILVKTEEEARLIKSQVENGADFEDLARRTSLDETAFRGGDLGFFQKGRFVPEFEEAVFAMKKGEIGGPVHSQFGYHVIKVTDRLEPTLRQFRDVEEFVQQRLLTTKRGKAFKTLVEKPKGNAKVEIDEKRLESLKIST